jgi:5-methyltetrahydrofolate--homocysteine methyltransferase
VLFEDEEHGSETARFPMLRQQRAAGNSTPLLSLADYVAPAEAGRRDHVGAFAVTAGHGLEELVATFEADHDDYSAILAKALADRLAEALAERLHLQVRHEGGYGETVPLSNEDLLKERYRGIRPAPGYPASPDHTEKATLWRLLDVERAAGIRLTESFAMHPPAGAVLQHRKDRRGPARRLRVAEGDAGGGGGALAGAAPGLRVQPATSRR